MKQESIINAEKRTHSSTGANRRLREDGYLPGNICGKGMESISIRVKKDDLRKSLHASGRNAVFKLNLVGDQAYDVVVREIQNLPSKGGDLHVDFQKINLLEDMKTDVSIKLSGEESLNSQSYILITQMDTLPLKGLPQAMPDSVKIDVSKLQPGQNILVGSITLPKGIICELDPEQVVLTVKTSHLADTLEAADVEAATAQ
ncbi:MAG: 50S ribosomal protein L25 [Eubacteriales bacterium]|nr:50S ribosomal protein L25 [Eubacteriales bacterium]MDD3349583.1 50S ribosomal protein L25 [Eubacteriales bacterium]